LGQVDFAHTYGENAIQSQIRAPVNLSLQIQFGEEDEVTGAILFYNDPLAGPGWVTP
jgi:hypothetical protein